MAEGLKICLELIAADFTIRALYCTEAVYPLLRQLTKSVGKNIEISTVSDNELEKISLLLTAREVIALIAYPEPTKKPIVYPVIIADDIQDPGNLGTLIRIADWFGFPTLITSVESVEWQNPKVIQASMGSFLRVRISSMPLTEFFKSNTKTVYGALLEGISIYSTQFKADGVLVLGNEARGITLSTMPYIEQAITIPRIGAAESLNVAIAGAIICAEIRRTNIL